MAKKKRETNAEHSLEILPYQRNFSEATSKSRDKIIDYIQQQIKGFVRHKESEYEHLVDRACVQRREEALRRSFPSVMEMYKMTEKTHGLFPTADVWTHVNLFCLNTLENIEDDASIVLGAALWLLDNIEEKGKMLEILEQFEFEEDWDLPPCFDLAYDEDVAEGVAYIFKHRYSGKRFLLDPESTPGETCDAFHALLDLVPQEQLQRAVAAVRSSYWKMMDIFFEEEYKIADHFVKCVDNYNSHVNVYNKMVQTSEVLRREIKVNSGKTAAMLANGKKAAGSPMMNANPQTDPLGIFSREFKPVSPFDYSQTPQGKLESTLNKMSDELKVCQEVGDKADDALIMLRRFGIYYARSGFLRFGAYEEDFEPLELQLPQIVISNPYQLCMGILLLCSPTAMTRIYKDVKGANIEKDLDLPWLSGTFCGMTVDIAAHLPWGENPFDGFDVEIGLPTKPLAHPNWYEKTYSDGENPPKSIAQILYESTGAVLPRDMSEYDNMHATLRKYGIRGKKEAQFAEMMTLLSAPQTRTRLYSDYKPEESTPTEDVEALKEKVKTLTEQLKKVTNDAHALDRRTRKAEQALQQEKEQAATDRQELAALREILFMRENAEKEESVSVALPYHAKRRIVIYGGHDSWRKSIREYLTGDVRFMDKNQAIIDRNVIRNADAVWIQANALSHRQYYAIMDEVRKNGVPVRYFLYASAKKCAEQVALDES